MIFTVLQLLVGIFSGIGLCLILLDLYRGDGRAFSGHKPGKTVFTLKNLAECADGKVELVVNGEHQQYADCEQALVNAAGKYVVKSISARADTLVIELTDHSVVQNDLNADWVKDQEKETGEAISFF